MVGTRPEIIKMAPVYHDLKTRNEFDVRWISSGQHSSMLEQAHKVFHITPDIDFKLMLPKQTPLGFVGLCCDSLEKIWRNKKPFMVLCQGDTTTAFAAALTGFYAKIPVGHIEAGLRSHALDEPFPEEGHRRLISTLTTLHFAPTALSAQNLLDEHHAPETIFNVGNTVIDALMSIPAGYECPAVEKIPSDKKWVLVTTHRRENHGARLKDICTSVLKIRDACNDIDILLPVHPNPQVQETVFGHLDNQPRIHLLPPLDYSDFVHVMRKSSLILTDSGGIQEEAPAFGIPVLVLREQTERPEAVQAGVAKLVGTNVDKIVTETVRLLSDSAYYQSMQRKASLFGDGQSAKRIVDAIQAYSTKTNLVRIKA